MRNNEELKNEIRRMFEPSEEGKFPSLTDAIALLLEISTYLLDKDIQRE